MPSFTVPILETVYLEPSGQDSAATFNNVPVFFNDPTDIETIYVQYSADIASIQLNHMLDSSALGRRVECARLIRSCG